MPARDAFAALHEWMSGIRLYDLEERKRQEQRDAVEAQKKDIDFGSQIRSYVLQPYQMVKDLRTNVERSDPQKVLDGDLDEFMAASLAARVGEGKDKKKDAE